MLPLPVPERGGSIEALISFLNPASRNDFVLIVAWLLVALRAHGPDVTFSPEGDIFISDGYINSRIAKADKGGNWIKSWGNRGNNPGEFNTPHNIGADSQGRIYVADHGNRRIQVFDSEGNFLRTLTISVLFDENTRPAIGNKPDLKTYQQVLTFIPGAPWPFAFTPPPNKVLYTSDAYPGRVYKLTFDGKLLGVLAQSGKQLKQFGWIHEIACHLKTNFMSRNY
jgi:hypothetical protein